MKIQVILRTVVIVTASSAATAFSQDVVAPAPAEGGATTIYRHVMPDGRVVYSDKTVKGARVDHTIKIEPPIKGNLWTTEPGARPNLPQQSERTPVRRVASVPAPGQKKTVDEAATEVIRAEMLLEDAKKRQEAGAEPLPGERTASAAAGARLSEAYQSRQRSLAREVEQAEAALRKAIAERDALR